MMKSPHCASSLKPSNLCRWLLGLLAVKTCVLFFLLFNSENAYFGNNAPGDRFTDARAGFYLGLPAHAADAPAPAAPPSVTPELSRSEQAAPASSSPLPSANASGPSPTTSALPLISGPPAEAAGSTGGAAQQGPDGLTRDMLTRKQEELARKEQELKALEGHLSEKLKKMESLENRLAIMMKEADTLNDAKFKHLVDVLSNMKAKAAAQVLETLDPRIAVKVLAGMQGRQAGEILTYVKPEVAASLTAALTRMQLPVR